MRRDAHDVTSNELDLYTWTRYVPPSVIHGFEQKYGLKVKVTYYASNEEAIRGIEANPGKYDIVIPSDYAVHILRDRDLLESINPTTDLRNWGNVDPASARRRSIRERPQAAEGEAAGAEVHGPLPVGDDRHRVQRRQVRFARHT